MASILDRYGIKEVADVTFYELDDNGAPQFPVLYLDTLKVSTIEQTAEEAEARGGKGNAALIAWDYGKEITVTLEDALFSAKSMAIMFGNGSVEIYEYSDGKSDGLLMKTEQFIVTANIGEDGEDQGTSLTEIMSGNKNWNPKYTAPDGKLYDKVNPKFYEANGKEVGATLKAGKYFCSFDLRIKGSVIEISANSFPSTYYVTGDTYARSETTGKDEFFQFIVPKAKVQSENTITLEAEGDPSVFNMNLKVLRPADGVMMKLVKYELADEGAEPEVGDVSIFHNHTLNTAKEPTKEEMTPVVSKPEETEGTGF